jgi:hypothetical protein
MVTCVSNQLLINIATYSDTATKLAKLHHVVVEQLPSNNFILLQHIIGFMKRIAERSGPDGATDQQLDLIAAVSSCSLTG